MRSALLAALALLAAPIVAVAQDVQPVIDAIGGAIPAAIPYLAAIPVVQVVAALLERATRRTHSTKLNTVLRWIAALPIRPPTLPTR